MNKVMLIGNVGKDPEVREFDNNKVCRFTLATNETYKNKQGDKITDTEWHNIVFWGKLCDIIEKYVHKGDQIFVEGKNVTRKYEDKEGNARYTIEVVCHNFEFIGKKEKPDNKEGKWQKGKDEVTSMSNADDLPGKPEPGLPF